MPSPPPPPPPPLPLHFSKVAYAPAETFLATDETEKCVNICVFWPQLSSVAVAGTENRMDEVHSLQLEGYRKFDFMLLHSYAALCGECSYTM